MRPSKLKGIVLVFVIAIAFWLFDAMVDIVLYWKPPFLDPPDFKIAIHAAYSDLISLLYIVILGLVVLRYMRKFNESEARYQQLFNSIDDLIYIQSSIAFNNHEPLSDANAATYRKLGYNQNELLQLTPADIVPPAKLPELSATMQELLRNKHILYQTIYVAKDGKEFPVEINAHMVNLRGQPAILSIARDITERKRSEEILKQSEAQFRAIFERAAIGIIFLDLSGRFVRANDALLRDLGYTQGELSGRHFSELSYPDDLEKDLELFAELTGGERDYYQIEKRYICKNGELMWCLKIASLVRDPDGKPQFVIGMLEDITARKRGEEALRQAKDELEKRVEERTSDLTVAYQKLLHEMEERRRAEQAVQDSAERLRTLTFQIINAEESERRRISVTLHDELGQELIFLKYQITNKLRGDKKLKIDSDDLLQKLDGIIGKVRQISHYLSPIILEELGLTAAIKYLFEEFCQQYECACTISNKPDEVGEVSSHPHTCRLLEAEGIDGLLSHQDEVNAYRILQESLTNVSKHSEASRVVVAVKKQDNHILFEVEDDGKGFDAQKALAIGSAFKGIGLIAMKERLRMSGGSLNIESHEDSGTKISFIIPIKQG